MPTDPKFNDGEVVFHRGKKYVVLWSKPHTMYGYGYKIKAQGGIERFVPESSLTRYKIKVQDGTMPPDPKFDDGEVVFHRGKEYVVLWSKPHPRQLHGGRATIGYKIKAQDGTERFVPESSLTSHHQLEIELEELRMANEVLRKNMLEEMPEEGHQEQREEIYYGTEPEWKYRGFESQKELDDFKKLHRRSEMNVEELMKLADLLDSRGEYAAANEVDNLIKKYAEEEQTVRTEDEDTMKDLGEGEVVGSEEPTLTMEPKDPRVHGEEQLREAFERFLESPRRFELVHRLKKAIDDYVKTYAMRHADLQPVFEKLSHIADNLDVAGEIRGANLIDEFLNKYADEEMYEEEPEQETKLSLSDHLDNLIEQGFITKEDKERMLSGEDDDQGYIDHMGVLHSPQHKEVGPVGRDEVAAIKEELAKLESNSKPSLSKRALDWKDEADTDQSKRYDSEYHHKLQIREPKTDGERVDREGREEYHIDTYKPHEGTLQTRYCPDHIGSMMGRVGPSTYQCPLDGNVYNWETGFTDFEGNKVPGGSVAGQTPNSTGYEIPHRIFDSRSKVLNVVN